MFLQILRFIWNVQSSLKQIQGKQPNKLWIIEDTFSAVEKIGF